MACHKALSLFSSKDKRRVQVKRGIPQYYTNMPTCNPVHSFSDLFSHSVFICVFSTGLYILSGWGWRLIHLMPPSAHSRSSITHTHTHTHTYTHTTMFACSQPCGGVKWGVISALENRIEIHKDIQRLKDGRKSTR